MCFVKNSKFSIQSKFRTTQWRELSWDKMKGNIRQIDEIPMIINVAKVTEQPNTVSYPSKRWYIPISMANARRIER